MTEPILPPEPANDATADELEADIAATREQLGATIDALENKLNVPAQARRKVNRTKTQVADKVNASLTQVTSRINQTRAQVSDTVAHTKAKVTGRARGTTGRVTETVGPTEGPLSHGETGPAGVTFTGNAAVTGNRNPGEGGGGVTDRVKHISTGLAAKVTATIGRTKADGRNGDDARHVREVRDPIPAAPDSAEPEPATSTSRTATPTAGRVGQTTAILRRTAGQISGRARQNPLNALLSVGAVLAGAVALWLAWRETRKTGPAAAR